MAENEPTTQELAHFTFAAFQTAIKSLTDKLPRAHPDSLDLTFPLMHSRMAEGLSSLVVLEDHSEHDHLRDSATILRVLYDLHIQFLFILTEPVKHSVNFINFGAVEKYNMLEIFERHAPKMMGALQLRAEWVRERAEIVASYNRIKQDFEYTKKGVTRVRKHWHEGQLDDLAIKVGREAEYRVVQKRLSAIVHSSSAVLLNKTIAQLEPVFTGHKLLMRVVGGIAGYLKVPFDTLERTIYEQAVEPIS